MAVKKRTATRVRKAVRKTGRAGRVPSRLWAIAVILAAGAAAGIIYNLLSPRGLFRPAPVPKVVEQEAAKPEVEPAKPRPKPKPGPKSVMVTSETIQTAPRVVEVKPPEPAPSETLLEAAAPAEAVSGCPAMSLEDAYACYQQGSAIFVDARSGQSFALGHIPRAINIPASDFEAAFSRSEKSLPRGAKIIVYCQSESCDQAKHICDQLAGKGYTNLMHYSNGWITWQYSGLPKE